jgi:hypothetical protein
MSSKRRVVTGAFIERAARVFQSLVGVLLTAGAVRAGDCNANGVPDVEEIVAGRTQDCNADLVPDECEIIPTRFGTTDEDPSLEHVPRAVAVADFDGDGFDDIAVAAQVTVTRSVVSILHNRGDRNLELEPEFDAGANLQSLAALDLDGDGDIDLATANFDVVLLFENDGNGVFRPGGSLPVPRFTRFVMAADVTGDGHSDLILLNSNEDMALFFTRREGDAFSLLGSAAVGDSPDLGATGDLDGDGDVDLVVANRKSRDVSVLLNSGGGHFDERTDYLTGARVSGVLLEDIDGDQDLDAVVGVTSSIRVFRNQGDGTFEMFETFEDFGGAFSLGDFNGDGNIDLVSTDLAKGSLRVRANPGDGRFLDSTVFSFDLVPELITAGDFDGDDDTDLVLFDSGSRRVVALWSAEIGPSLNGLFQLENLDFPVERSTSPAAGRPHAITLGDLDGDGLPEVITANGGDGSISVLHNRGDGTVEFAERYEPGNGHTLSITAGDVNLDGHTDVVATNRDQSVLRVLLNDGEGRLGAPIDYEAPLNPLQVLLRDFDGDGAPEVVTANQSGSSPSVFWNDGDGSFPRRLDLSGRGFSVAVADFDGEGSLDLVTVNRNAVSLSVFLNHGDNTFAQAARFPLLLPPLFVASADFDGDGLSDVALANERSVSVRVNQGSALFPRSTRYSLNANPYSLITSDLNGDRFPDIVTANESQGSVSVVLGNGDGAFQQHFEAEVGRGVRHVIAGDLDLDGDLDLASANRGSADVTILENRGGGAATLVPHVERVCTGLQFERLSAPVDPYGERSLHYAIAVGSDDPPLFQNVRLFTVTLREFLRRFFPERYGGLTEADFTDLVGRRDTRKLFAGSIHRVRVGGRAIYGFSVMTEAENPAERLTQDEVAQVFAVLSESFTLRPLGFLPVTPESREVALAWDAPVFPIYEVPLFPDAEPSGEVPNPTFTLTIPLDTTVCGAFGVAGADRGPREEYQLKSTATLRGGTIALTTETAELREALVEEIRFGPALETLQSAGPGLFRLLRVPGGGGLTIYRFNYEQDFKSGDGTLLRLELVSPLEFRARGEVAVVGRRVLDEEFFTARPGTEAFELSLDGLPLVRYSSCTHTTLPRYEITAHLEDRTTVHLVERFLEVEEVFDTGPASLQRARVVFPTADRLVLKYSNLIYSAFRHNTDRHYWTVFEVPVFLPGLEREVHALELVAPELPERPRAEAAYLDADFAVLTTIGVNSFEKGRVDVTPGSRFLRGDVLANGGRNVADALALLNYLFGRHDSLPCPRAADINDDGSLNLLDPLALVAHLFRGREALAEPFTECGRDATEDGLPCEAFAPCD